MANNAWIGPNTLRQSADPALRVDTHSDFLADGSRIVGAVSVELYGDWADYDMNGVIRDVGEAVYGAIAKNRLRGGKTNREKETQGEKR